MSSETCYGVRLVSSFDLPKQLPKQSNSLNFNSKNSTIPHPNPNAALDPVNETAAQTNITKDSSFEFISLEAIANSIPANNRSTPSIPIGN
uniref:Putative ovule protein n=1 Tax=Solanum chacoense TaxID=4108 RepID=A0A0V0GS02_SOLCH